jgi:hypothetical protein
VKLCEIAFLIYIIADYEDQKFLSAETSVKKLVKILDENKFQSGSSIDFYDYE